jgi:hypothetical protein
MTRLVLSTAAAAALMFGPVALAAGSPNAAAGDHPAATAPAGSPEAATAAGHDASASTLDPNMRGPAQTGQPNASCETTPNTPGASASAPGSAFNPDGTAGSHYAGEQPQNSRNTASVSQYDAACAHQPH